jgi:hypothetical protein
VQQQQQQQQTKKQPAQETAAYGRPTAVILATLLSPRAQDLAGIAESTGTGGAALSLGCKRAGLAWFPWQELRGKPRWQCLLCGLVKGLAGLGVIGETLLVWVVCVVALLAV